MRATWAALPELGRVMVLGNLDSFAHFHLILHFTAEGVVLKGNLIKRLLFLKPFNALALTPLSASESPGVPV